MLSIDSEDFDLFGCPNCGCDSASGSSSYYYGITTGTCRNCKLYFEIRPVDAPKDCVRYGIHKEDPSDPHSKMVMEESIMIPHPRKGRPAWHWEPEDVRPEVGEYWASRGVGYPDVSGFVKTKKAGERILAIVHEVLGTENCKTFLDFRPSEPTWIQFKFHQDEFDCAKLSGMSRANDGVITKEIIAECKLL